MGGFFRRAAEKGGNFQNVLGFGAQMMGTPARRPAGTVLMVPDGVLFVWDADEIGMQGMRIPFVQEQQVLVGFPPVLPRMGTVSVVPDEQATCRKMSESRPFQIGQKLTRPADAQTARRGEDAGGFFDPGERPVQIGGGGNRPVPNGRRIERRIGKDEGGRLRTDSTEKIKAVRGIQASVPARVQRGGDPRKSAPATSVSSSGGLSTISGNVSGSMRPRFPDIQESSYRSRYLR